MPRLIDANGLYQHKVVGTIDNISGDFIPGYVIAMAPTIDAEPVRHGEWIVQKVDANQTKFYCSECERTVLCGNDYFMKPSEYVAKIYPYCHCGAKMNLKE